MTRRARDQKPRSPKRPKRGQGEGSIYQRSDGRWVSSLTIDGGRRRTFYGPTRRDVQLKLALAQRAKDDGLLTPGSDQTVESYLQSWLADMVRPSVRPSTYDNYELNVRRLTPFIGRIRMSELKPAAIQGAYGALLRSGLSARTVEQAHTVLHRALHQAVMWNLIPRNPVDAVSRPRPKRPELNTLDKEQLRQLFASTKGDPLHPLWVLLATTGLRVGEALGLGWKDVDLELGRLTVRRALQRQKGKGFVMVEPKTDRSRRTVYLAPGTVEVLKEHHRLQTDQRRLLVGNRDPRFDLVFTKANGRPLENGMVNWTFHKALEKAGLPRVRVHDLRHTAATQLLQKGVHPKMVQELLGHSTIVLTLDTYSHVIPVMHAEVAGHMQDLFESGTGGSARPADKERGS